MAGARFADLLFYLFDAAEFDAGAPAGLLGTHSGSDLFVGEHRGVGTYLFVEFLLGVLPAEEILRETR
jgi:hypothetical protein